jgi:hypothetical protein
MPKLARVLTLAALVAAASLAGMTAVAQAHPTDQPSNQAEATVRRLQAREGLSIPDQTPARPRLLLNEEPSSLLNLPNRVPAQAAADAAHRRLLAQERYYTTWGYGGASAPAAPAEPSGQPTWLVIALAVLAAVMALVAGIAVLAAHRVTRSQHAGQTA